MMNRITHNTAAAVALQNAAEQRRAQTAAAQTTQQAGAQYNFAEIFGGGVATGTAPKTSTPAATHTQDSFDTVIAAATAQVIKEDTGERQPATIPSNTESTAEATTESTTPAKATDTISATTAATTATAATTTAAAATPAATTTSSSAGTTPGVEAVVAAIMNGSLQATYVTNPAK